ncbi:MAG: hypothetical protein L0H15_03165 [Nitrosospira sp.]|nr:hypothetical protein [Nitrosospira sp.]MDN5882743.1 hypothetical protein [Nitrosospira sp.]MDN5934838.1 hypothetical protein [Nitrosospira sp.]
MPEHETWASPDALGICTRDLDVGAKSTLRGRRLRRAFPDTLHTLGGWPTEWRELLIGWIRASSPKRKWDTLLSTAGSRRVHLAHELLDALLRAGWVEVEERRQSGRWLPLWVNFLELSTLRYHLGLADKDALAELFCAEAVRSLQDVRLVSAQQSLSAASPQSALRRLALLRALDVWLTSQRFGTRRDFSLFARGTTKAISTAEWEWLEHHVDLVELGIERHSPALWLRAPVLLSRGNLSLDLRLIDDCIALTPGTLDSLTRIEGRIGCWRLLENRTSFERAARRYGDNDFVVWLPGFAPSWWRQSVAQLLTLCPASALIACDPDPAGIEIALQAAEIWDEAGLSWQPWGMDVETLSGLPHCQSLSPNDEEQLQRLLQQPLPASLQALADWMRIHAKKGEQEGAI